jgi:hypothetical protein
MGEELKQRHERGKMMKIVTTICPATSELPESFGFTSPSTTLFSRTYEPPLRLTFFLAQPTLPKGVKVRYLNRLVKCLGICGLS